MLEKQIKMQKKIETYIYEGLPSNEEDELWVEFLLDKRWFWYYVSIHPTNCIFRVMDEGGSLLEKKP